MSHLIHIRIGKLENVSFQSDRLHFARNDDDFVKQREQSVSEDGRILMSTGGLTQERAAA